MLGRDFPARKEPMNISVVIVCYNEQANIEECLRALIDQDIPKDEYEIVVVDGSSTDGTKDIIDSFAERHENIKIVTNPAKNIAGSRNIGINNASFDLVAFTDADCVVPGKWLSNYKKAYSDYMEGKKGIAGIGSGNTPPEGSRFYEALGSMLGSFLGSRGSVQGMNFAEARIVDHIPCFNVMYGKQFLLEAGGFDESLGNIGEDQDMTFRLNKAGQKFYYIPENIVVHKMRNNYFKWAANMFVYGKGRVWLIKKHPEMFSVLFLMPVALILFFVLFPFLSFCRMFVLIYFAGILFSSMKAVEGKKGLNTFLATVLLFPVTHISYGLGEIYGLFSGYFPKKDKLSCSKTSRFN